MAQRTKPVRQQLAELRRENKKLFPEAEVKKRNPNPQRSELQVIASEATFLKRRMSAAFGTLRDAAKYASGQGGNDTILFSAIDNLDDNLTNIVEQKTERLRSEAVRRQLAAGAKVVAPRKTRSRRA